MNVAEDYNRPHRGHWGASGLDRTHQFKFTPTWDLPHGLRLSMIAHLASPLPLSAYVPQQDGGGVAGEIFRSDLTGDGTVGDLLPNTVIGSTGKYSTTNLTQVISRYNQTFAGKLTPAGQALATAGLFSTPATACAGRLCASDSRAALACRNSDLAEDDGSAFEPAVPGWRAGEAGAERFRFQRFQLGQFRRRRIPVKRRDERRAGQFAEQREFGGILRQLHHFLHFAAGPRSAWLGHVRDRSSAANRVGSAHHVLTLGLAKNRRAPKLWRRAKSSAPSGKIAGAFRAETLPKRPPWSAASVCGFAPGVRPDSTAPELSPQSMPAELCAHTQRIAGALSRARRAGVEQVQNELVIALLVEVDGELLGGATVLSLSCVVIYDNS